MDERPRDKGSRVGDGLGAQRLILVQNLALAAYDARGYGQLATLLTDHRDGSDVMGAEARVKLRSRLRGILTIGATCASPTPAAVHRQGQDRLLSAAH